MDKPDSQTLLIEVEAQIAALESACAQAERALMRGQWDDVNACILDQRRLQHALQNALHAAAGSRSTQFDEQMFKRLRRIGLVRDGQIARLRQYQEQINARLNTLNRWKRAARSWLSGYQSKRPRALDQMR